MTVRGEIITTGDGSPTVRHELFGELYHSDRGAVGEAEHVYIRNGLEFAGEDKKEVSVFEVGFGTGLNGWLTWEYAREHGMTVDYYAVERYPLSWEVVSGLSYSLDRRFQNLHGADFETDEFRLKKHEVDLLEFDGQGLRGSMDVIYFDAFAPEVQPELWSVEVMRKMYDLLGVEGVLVTYSAKGVVKENLRSAGFEVTRLRGALGKRHMVRAIKK